VVDKEEDRRSVMSATGARSKDRGPEIRETIFAQKIAKFLTENSEIKKWAEAKARTREGQGEIVLLVCAALTAKKQN
jgi:hypothetical protein